MKLVEILASAVVHGHIFHLEPGFDECAQGSPSSVIVIEKRTEGGDVPLAQVTDAPPDVRHGVRHKAMAAAFSFIERKERKSINPSKRQTGCRPSGKAGVMSFGASVPLNRPVPRSS